MSHITDEFDHHFAETVEALKAQGWSDADAHAEAARRFGDRRAYAARIANIDGTAARRRWFAAFLDETRLNFRDAVRALRAAPILACVAIASLAVGIGANAAVFSIVDAFLLTPLPVTRPDELVLFRLIQPAQGSSLRRRGEGPGSVDPATGRNAGTPMSLLMLERARGQRSGLAEVFAFAPLSQVHVLVDGIPEVRVSAQYVSGNYYDSLGVSAAKGRVLSESDDSPTAPVVTVISDRYWRARFRGDSPIGKTIVINRIPVVIVGVAPRGFEGAMQAGETAEISLPLAHHLTIQPDRKDRAQPWYWWLRVMGRLAPGVSRVQAQAALEPPLQQAARDGWLASGSAGPMPGDVNLALDAGAQGENDVRRQFAPSLRALTGLVAVVLMVACTNLAMLLVSRGADRRGEVAVRLALGAPRGRIIRQFLAEAALLAGAGAAAALIVAVWGSRLLMNWQPFGATSVVLDLSLDARAVAFTTLIALVAMAAVGVAPAWRASRTDPIAAFRGGTRALVGDGRAWLSRALLVVQIALSLVLVVGAGLFIRTLNQLHAIDPGFNTQSLAWFRLDVASAGYKPPQFADLATRVQAQLAAIPGIRDVTFSRVPLLSRTRQNMTFTLPGIDIPVNTPAVNTNGIAHNFLQAMGIAVIAGRSFDDRDNAASAKVAIPNETFVRSYLGDVNPIGRAIVFNAPGFSGPAEIVGIARDAKYTDLRSATPATVYLSSRQQPDGVVNFAFRTAGDPAQSFPSIARAVAAIDPSLPVLDLRTQDEQIDRLHGQQRLFAKLAGVCGATALLLSAVGLYGLLSQTVSRRSSEIGLRMALGADRATMVTMVLRESWRMLAIGVAAGAGAAYAAGGLVSSLLFGVAATDPVTYLTAAGVLMLVGTMAALVPALRASRIEPLTALRGD